MAFAHHRLQTGPLAIRTETGRFISSEEIGGRVLNMELTEAGTLRSVRGPVEYHPEKYLDDGGGTLPSDTDYAGPYKGIFHAKLAGGKRDVLLAHFDGSVQIHDGFIPNWRPLVGNAPSPFVAELEVEFPEDDDRPAFLTQFEAAPNGIIIVPQGGRAYFYDGTVVAPLGFDTAPGPPSPVGPRSTEQDVDGQGGTGAPVPGQFTDDANTVGYSHNGRDLNQQMGVSRLGTLRNDVLDIADGGNKLTNPLGGVLEEGEWRAALQFIDRWGNLSPISGRSAPIRFAKEDNLTKERKKDDNELSNRLRLQVAWTDLDLGPTHCVGRDLLRTRDLLNTELPGLFQVPANATDSALTFATLQDNVTTMFPDNVPDSWLVARPTEVVPVPLFRLCRMAFGRLWIANTTSAPGLVRPSMPGFWGTFPVNQEIYPDAGGAAITGLWTASQGLLVFTESSTFLISQADTSNAAGDLSFRASTLSPFAGCVAPDSIRTLPNGLTVWLGREGFYSWDGEVVRLISREVKENVIRRINTVRAQQATSAVSTKAGVYRCWIPVDGNAENILGMEYDGTGWRELDYITVHAVCTTRDSRQYMLALGSVVTNETPAGHTSVWLLDHEGKGNQTPAPRDSIVETAWLKNSRGHRRSSPLRITLWLRETSNANIDSIEAMRDWREHPLASATGVPPELHPSDDIPNFWGVAVLGAEYENKMSSTQIPVHYHRRRPYWSKVDLEVPACETFRVRIKHSGDWDFIGVLYEDHARDAGGMMKPGGGRE